MSDPTLSPHTPATPRTNSRSWMLPASIVTAVVVILVVAGTFTYLAMRNGSTPAPSRRDMTLTAISGIEAMITGDGNKLASLSDATMKSQLTPAFIAQMNSSGVEATFTDPQWNGDKFVIEIDSNRGAGTIVGGAVPDGKNAVVFRTMGKVGATTGEVVLTYDGSHWLITAFAAGPSAMTSSSVPATAAPSSTTTP